jgi:hypothetical protein
MIDVKALKVGQKLYAHIGRCEVFEATVEDMKEKNGPYFERRINLANWDGSYNGLPKESHISFDLATGKEFGSYGLSADGWDSRPTDVNLTLVAEDRRS